MAALLTLRDECGAGQGDCHQATHKNLRLLKLRLLQARIEPTLLRPASRVPRDITVVAVVPCQGKAADHVCVDFGLENACVDM